MLILKPNPGDTCRVCKTGKLEARTKTHNSTNHQVIGGPVFPTTFILVELVCGACGLKFEPKHVGREIKELLEDQLLTFKNPETKPIQCPTCNANEFTTNRRVRDEDDLRPSFEYCRRCLKVVWGTPPKPITSRKNPAEDLEPFLEAVGIKPKSRGPATPIPQGKKPVRRRRIP